MDPKSTILSSVKDKSLIKRRRTQIISGAITLFKQKGFHRTTTKEIAKESGFSIGTLYEYIRTKEDVLVLVYEAIDEHVHQWLESVIVEKPISAKKLIWIIDSYYRLIDGMQDEITILYQEIKSLEPKVQKAILKREREKVQLMKRAIMDSIPERVSCKEAELLANNIFVQGHMWGFRSWLLSKQYTIDEYIKLQLRFLFTTLNYEELLEEAE